MLSLSEVTIRTKSALSGAGGEGGDRQAGAGTRNTKELRNEEKTGLLATRKMETTGQKLQLNVYLF